MKHLFRTLGVACAAASLTLTLSTGPAHAASDEYVALGDSFAAGNGAGNPDLDYFCSRSSDAYAPIIAAERPGTTLKFAACGGATTADVLNQQQSSVTSATDYVTLSIGGNDVGFLNLILSCWNTYDEAGCLQEASAMNTRIQNELPAKLNATHAALKARAPQATMMQVGYPRFFGSSISCAQAHGMSNAERTALNGVADNLDRVIGERSRANGFVYLSAIGRFAGHELCTTTPYINGKWAWSAVDIYHPTKAGYRSGYAPLVRSIMG